MYEGLQIVNEIEGTSYFICAIDKWSDRVAVIDVKHLEDPKNGNGESPKYGHLKLSIISKTKKELTLSVMLCQLS